MQDTSSQATIATAAGYSLEAERLDTQRVYQRRIARPRVKGLGSLVLVAEGSELEAPPGFEPGIKDLQSSALPLGYGAPESWTGGPGDESGAATRIGLTCRRPGGMG